jgi:hypothetical protein
MTEHHRIDQLESLALIVVEGEAHQADGVHGINDQMSQQQQNDQRQQQTADPLKVERRYFIDHRDQAGWFPSGSRLSPMTMLAAPARVPSF